MSTPWNASDSDLRLKHCNEILLCDIHDFLKVIVQLYIINILRCLILSLSFQGD